MNRRRALSAIGGGLLALGSFRAVDNVLLGYGHVDGGTNLLDQELDGLLDERLELDPVTVDGERGSYELLVESEDERAWLRPHGGEWSSTPSPTDAVRRADDDHGLAWAVTTLVEDAAAIERGAHDYEFHGPEGFFDRVRDAEHRPAITGAMRGSVAAPVSPETVVEFAAAEPSNPEALANGLAEGFREYGSYDVPRYVGGSIQDNVLLGRVDLRAPFEVTTDLDSLLERGHTGLFCWELSYRAIEAFHAVPAVRQAVPVAAFWVRDRRHKHVYNGLATAFLEDGLRIAVTFLDYTHSTLYHDVRLTGLAGERLSAYDEWHRADEVHWDVPDL
ncbi:hypothetical protein [Natronorarus salvus]|uniref:hypothetical protein n=1 Tax=Natronorarus salvus TaxID=3117733 RepID=UPI002F26B5E1